MLTVTHAKFPPFRANAKQDDFDSLMVTPHDPTPAQIAIAASVKVKEEPLEACRKSFENFTSCASPIPTGFPISILICSCPLTSSPLPQHRLNVSLPTPLA